ncbi:DEAD/DEAH box helicase family protein [Sporosarcina sp. FSL K6-5500]|uniref:DEAD/DEAH box helicase family protein n=1 Tax=Sporosarcina sp. FSL K6-5500 TaxID=2921558 RepID=UPI0030FB6A19
MNQSYLKQTSVFISDNLSLRKPQREAHKRLVSSIEKDDSTHKIIVLPTGAGKTGVMGITPFGISDGRVLIITPSLVAKTVFPNSPPLYFAGGLL